MTFKDLKKRVCLGTLAQQQSRLFERLHNKPFWIWNLMNTNSRTSKHKFMEELELRARNDVTIKEDCNSNWCTLLWTGTATELLASLEEIAVSKLKVNTHAKLWPKAANTLSRRINEIKTNLREIGITIDRCFIDKKKKSKGIKICKVSTEPSEPSETENHAQLTSDISDDIDNGQTILSIDGK